MIHGPAAGDAPGPSTRDLAENLARSLADRRSDRRTWLFWLVAGSLAVTLALTALLLPRTNVNWDEFHYLAQVYEARRGELSQSLATFHVHFFRWLAQPTADEVERVIAARWTMFALHLASVACIVSIARRFVAPDAALFAGLSYAAFAFVVRHAVGFRADPICVLLLLLATRCLLAPRSRLSWSAGGVAMAVASMFTPKATIHLALVALLALVLLVFGSPRRRALERLAIFSASHVPAWLLLRRLHESIVRPTEVAVTGAASVGEIAGKMFGEGVLLPQARFVIESLRHDTVTWILLGAGVLLAAAAAVRGGGPERGGNLLLLLFAAPVGTLLFYRNSFPYYFVFVLPLAAITVAAAVDRLLRAGGSAGGARRLLAAALTLATLSSVVLHAARGRLDQTAQQRQILAVVHTLFPEPVAYIDRCSMVSSFPKVGFFMSSWGVQRYRARRTPVFRELLTREPVPFLIANGYSLALPLPDAAIAGKPFSLLREDLELLRDNFLPHWGILFVQGKSFDFAEDRAARRFEILARGPFTVESDGGVELDGKAAAHGDVVELAAGFHSIAPSGGTGFARLRWGERLPQPQAAPLAAPLFTDF